MSQPLPARFRPTHAPSRLVLGLVLAVGVVLRVGFFENDRRTPDELFYTAYGGVVATEGIDAFPEIVERYRTTPRMWQYPAPTRVGAVLLAAGAVRLTGSEEPESVAGLSTVFSIVTLLLVAAFALRWFGPWTAVIATAFLACSPLDLAIARRAWQDGIFAAFAFATMWSSWEGAVSDRPGWWLPVTVLAGVGAALVKESGVLVMGVAFGASLLAAPPGRVRARLVMSVIGMLAGVALTSLVVALAGGGVDIVRGSIERLVEGTGQNDYIRQYQTGGALYYARGFGLLQPVPFALGAGCALLAVWHRLRGRSPGPDAMTAAARLALATFVIVFLLAGMIFTQKNLRFLSMIYAPVYLLAGDAIVRGTAALIRRAPAGRRWLLVAGVATLVVGSLALDVHRFVHWFIDLNIPDLATPWFTEGWRG